MATPNKPPTRYNLEPRERVLLMMIDENTDVDEGSGELFQYFHGEDNPSSEFLVSFQKDPVRLWEEGDRARLDHLVGTGLIYPPFAGEYNFVVTAAGHEVALACLGARQTVTERGRKRRAPTTEP